MNYKAMIFDLDGTLVDTLQDLTDAMNVALTAVGLAPRTAEECRMMIGNALPMFSRRAVGPENQHLAEPVAGRMRDYYRGHCCDQTAVYPGLLTVIEELRRRGVRLAVLTNKDQDVAKEIVEHYFGAGVFDDIVGATGHNRIKPDPTTALELIAGMRITTDEALFVGDSDVDIQTAAAAGIRSVGVAWGFRGREDLAAANADIIVESPAEILDLLA
ncbi:MAG: HAD family hydrolase [Phycisphaerae bacterium]|nr:HAD family hydrolase [Phycisphaerae bacterium]